MSFTITNVSIVKNNASLLQQISFQNQPEKHYLLTGKSGSGKSTFLDLIAGRVFPTQGKLVKTPGLKIISVSRDYAFHKIVGQAYQYYQQRYNVYDAEVGPTLYEVLQNQVKPIGTIDEKSVTLPPLAYTEEHLNRIVQLFKIEHLLQRKVTSLSNGETRKSLLAYWFLQSPDILLLDNPFSGLDAKSRQELTATLEQISPVQLFLVADPKDAPKSCTQVIHFGEGKISFQGHIDQLPQTPTRQAAEFPANKHTEIDFNFALRLKHVNVSAADKRILEDINWEVKAGECWAVIGPNGSGKSTLMSLLTGDHPQAYKNEIYLFDQRRGRGESIWDIKRKIGFVSPEMQLFFDKNIPVWKVIGSGYFDTMGLYRKLNTEQLELIDYYLHLFDLSSLRDKNLLHLSTGQQRLVLLIRAIIKNPPMLILDEPCQGLDYNQMVFFRDSLNNWIVSQKKTLIYITHYSEEIPACVNKRLYLNEGRILKVEL